MLIVQKYGGTSVGNLDRIRNVAQRVKKTKEAGHDVVVVVSAMAGETNRLVQLAKDMSPTAFPLHQDILLATGEQITVALLCVALQDNGISAEGFLGHQIRIITDDQHGRARIKSIDTERLQQTLMQKQVAVVAGFQGVTEKGAITTIGRGGSDTTAVALAAKLHADLCEIYTDVAGVYTADPRLVSDARLLHKLSYEEMLELADSGAKVLHSRSVEIAARYRVPLVVRSSFDESAGTAIVSEEEIMEDILVSGLTVNRDEAKIAIRRVPDEVGVTAHIFRPLSRAGINIDMIVQNVSADGFTDLTFTVPKEDLKRALELAEGVSQEIKAGKVEAAADIAKISVVGLGMRSHAGVAHTIFETLGGAGIKIQMISTSEIKVATVIDLKYAELAIRLLHDVFHLGEGGKSAQRKS